MTTKLNTMRSPFERAVRRESGAALVELAALSTILLLLLVGSIDYGHYLYDGIILGNAAQAGVQYGAHDDLTAFDTSGMQAAATNDATGITLSSATASTFCTCTDGTAAGTTTAAACTTTITCATGKHRVVSVQVVAAGTYNPLVTYPGIPASISLSRTAVMQVSQ